MKYNSKNKQCDKSMTFQDCELAILRMQVDQAQKKISKRIIQSDDILKIISIVEKFIKHKNLICYGGTAINNILPKEDQFYNKDTDLADYDFFSPSPINDAKELADIYVSHGFTEVEAKAGQHHGTYKVFVNYIPVADITNVHKDLFKTLKNDSIRIAGILYAPPNFLRMSMYLELSRPAGDTSRWEKILKRLSLLNKHYPLSDITCKLNKYQRLMDLTDNKEKIFNTIKNTLINQSVVFFGGYALSLYSKYMPNNSKNKLKYNSDFDVISHDPLITAEIIKERLNDENIKNVKIINHKSIDNIIPDHTEVIVNKDTVLFIYKPIACHSYNIIKIDGNKLKIATIDTMLSFYLAFLYINKPYYTNFTNRILCIASFMFEIQQKNRLSQKGLLQRFSITCYGHQESVEEMRSAKSLKFKELKNNKNSSEYEEYFLNYKPGETKTTKNKTTKNKTTKNKTTKNKTTKNKKIFGINFSY